LHLLSVICSNDATADYPALFTPPPNFYTRGQNVLQFQNEATFESAFPKCTTRTVRAPSVSASVTPHPVIQCRRYTMLEKTFHRSSVTCFPVQWTSFWSIPYCRKLCNKNFIMKIYETLLIRSAPCYTAGSDKSDEIEGVPY